MALAILLIDPPAEEEGYGALNGRVAGLMTELGWAVGPDRQPVGERDVGWALGGLYRRGVIGGFCEIGQGLRDGLSAAGRAAAAAALRARATGPRKDLP